MARKSAVYGIDPLAAKRERVATALERDRCTRRLVRDIEGCLVEYVVSLLDSGHFALHLKF